VDEFDIKFPNLDERPRQAFRAELPGLMAMSKTSLALFPVKDISATGMALVDEQARLGHGHEFECDLILNKKTLIHGLKAKVARLFDHGVVGCSFVDLPPRKEAALDKLVLEVQKRYIARHKAELKNE
jgi:c-di-GMP-binding flagellar brake protein YcgR